MELKPVELISLASLLHDIGKISQRARVEIKNNYNLEEYAPIKNNHPSYIHAAYTAEFLDCFVEEFKIKSEDDRMNLVNIASYHHKDIDEPFCKIVRYADHLASGFERTKQEEPGDYIEDQLISVFSSVKINKEEKEYRFPLKPLDFDVVPQEASQNTPEDYQLLFNGLKENLKKLKEIHNFDIFYDSLNYLLEKYAWCIPSSSFKAKSDISLYDHLRVSAAFAVALYRYYNQTGEICAPNDTKECFALIQGDFSGIQNFIFSQQGESNKFASKILRARSFFVSLSTELVAYKICTELGLTKASIVMNAGGKFTILSHNMDDLEEKLDKISNEINEEFARLSFGQTRFTIASILISPSDFLIENKKFSQKYEDLIKILDEKKLRPNIKDLVFKDYLKAISESKYGICKICGQHPANLKADDAPICEVCDHMKSIGESLVKNNFFGILSQETSESKPIIPGYYLAFEENPQKLSKASLVFEIGLEGDFTGYAKSKISPYVPRLTNEELELEKNKKYVTLDDIKDLKSGDIKPFSAIAKDALDDKGKKGSDFLGILKADVDNLGFIFSKGFGDNNSISKTVSLSRMLDFFFVGWLQNEIRNKFKSVYTVFSGGDDLFLIGPFNQIIDLAKRINEHFKEYTKNEDFHLSCGIYFAKDKIPVYQMAREAESILEESKNYGGKNAVTVFGKTLKWEVFNELMEIDLDNIFKEADVSDTFKYSLFSYLNMIENLPKTKNLLWKALFVYNVYRNVAQQKNKEEKDEAIKKFLSSMIYNFDTHKGDFIVPLSNYIYRNRKGRIGHE